MERTVPYLHTVPYLRTVPHRTAILEGKNVSFAGVGYIPEPEVYTNRSTGVDSGRSFNVSPGAGFGVISFQLLQEQEPE